MHVPAENPELVPNQAGFHGNASEVADIDLPGNRVTSNSDAFEYHFTLQKPSGGQTKIRLLRNGSWLSSQQRSWQYSAATGDWDWHYWIALSELGVEGWSRLEAAQAYSGSHDLALGANGGLVTGIFEHEGSVVDLRFVNESSEEVAITSTPNHRFWSESRQAFIACGELERGELVRGLTGGQWQLQARKSQPDARSVYNLEVSQEHVFYVGSGGILVHNMCDTGSQGGKHSGGDISGSGRTPANRLTPEAPPVSAPTTDTIRIRHYTNRRGSRGIENDQIIRASDQNRVFAEPARGKPLSPRDAEAKYGIKPGRGRDIVETDVPANLVQRVKNPITKVDELQIIGDVPLLNSRIIRRH